MKRQIVDFVRRLVGFPIVMERLRAIEIALSQSAEQAATSVTADAKESEPAKSYEVPELDYGYWASGHIRGTPPMPRAPLASSWDPEDPFGAIVSKAMMEAETAFAKELLRSVRDENIPGAIVEFGVFEGLWLEKLCLACEDLGLVRPIYGFDSFEGLPAPSAKDDLACWSEGQYAASLEAVSARLKCDERKHVSLVKGWFSNTLPQPLAQGIEQIAYARIDCDLYQPAVECLDYLQPRLSDGAILVFDDWTWNLQKGETKAFYEWTPKSGLAFEFLAYNSIGHLYLKVTKPR